MKIPENIALGGGGSGGVRVRVVRVDVNEDIKFL